LKVALEEGDLVEEELRGVELHVEEICGEFRLALWELVRDGLRLSLTSLVK
jgi:hypothetical protein